MIARANCVRTAGEAGQVGWRIPAASAAGIVRSGPGAGRDVRGVGDRNGSFVGGRRHRREQGLLLKYAVPWSVRKGERRPCFQRPGPLRADPKGWLFMRGKGGDFGPCLPGRKGTFRPYQTPEPQPRGAVTRRAVAQRRSRASGLTRLSVEAIRGFDSGFSGGPLACRSAVRSKSFVFSSLSIRKVLVLPF